MATNRKSVIMSGSWSVTLLLVLPGYHETHWVLRLQQSLFFATEAITVLHWSRFSDRIGRKPVVMIGLFGLSMSMICFGLSRTFWTLVLSRSFNGALNGNVGVLKSMLGEMTDPTNIAQAYSFIPVTWSIGCTLG